MGPTEKLWVSLLQEGIDPAELRAPGGKGVISLPNSCLHLGHASTTWQKFLPSGISHMVPEHIIWTEKLTQQVHKICQNTATAMAPSVCL